MWSKLLESVVGALAGASMKRIIEYVAPPPHAKSWLASPAAQHVMQKALLAALEAVAERIERGESPFFDEAFLTRADVAELLAQLLLPGGDESAVAAEMAKRWRAYLPNARTDRLPIEDLAAAFVAAYCRELRGYDPFRKMIDSQDLASLRAALASLKIPTPIDPTPQLEEILARLDAMHTVLQGIQAQATPNRQQTPLRWSLQLPKLPEPIADQGVLSQIPLLHANAQGTTLYVGSRDGQIHAYGVDGDRADVKWRVNLPAGYGVPEAFATWRNMLLVAPQSLQALDAAKDLLLLNLESGQISGRIPLPVRQMGAPAVEGDRAYTVGSDGTLFALDLTAGAIAWQMDQVGSFSPFAPVLADGRLLLPANSPTLLCVDPAAQRVCWRKMAQPAADGMPPHFMPSPLVVDGAVYAANWNGSLYAFDVESGHAQWRYAAGGALHGSPLLAGDLLLIASQDHKVHAVECATGKARWVSPDLVRRIYSRPTVVGDQVYVAPFRQELHALRLSDGKAVWDRPLALPDRGRSDLVAVDGRIFIASRRGHLAAVQVAEAPAQRSVDEWLDLGQWPQAVLHLLRQDETARAAALFFDHSFYYRAGRLYDEAGDSASAAEAYARDDFEDSWRRAAVLYRQRGDPAAAARQLEALQEWADAAQSWEEAGDPEKAAHIYHKQLKEYHHAAQLYLEAGKPSLAAMAYEAGGDFAAALQILRKAGAATYRDRMKELRPKAAKATSGEKRHKLLSELIADTEDAMEQAAIYAEFGEWTLAAEKWVEAGKWQQGVEMLVAKDALDRAIDLLRKQPGQEAQRWAADLLCRQERWADALIVYKEIDDQAGQALCHAKMDNWAQAAQAYEEAGRRAEVPKPDDETKERLADLFHSAAHAYARCYEERSERRLFCQQKARYYRGHPWLAVSFAPGQLGQRFVVGEANVLELKVENRGVGLARNVRVDLIDVQQPPRLRLYGQETISGIGRLRNRTQKVNLYAEEGGGILVDVHLSWTDPDDAQKSVRLDRWTIPVLDPNQRASSTPTSLHVEGNVYYTSGDVVHGDQYRDQAQNRDGGVEIVRNRAPSATPPSGVVCPYCRTPNPSIALFCDSCGREMGAG